MQLSRDLHSSLLVHKFQNVTINKMKEQRKSTERATDERLPEERSGKTND